MASVAVAPCDFYGLPAYRIQGPWLSLDFLAGPGLRLVGLRRTGCAENLLAELPDICWTTPWGEYRPRGGHRLMAAPEDLAMAYAPEMGDLEIQMAESGVCLRQRASAGSTIEKRIEVDLPPDKPGVRLRQALRNAGDAPIELAAWSVTQLPLGGLAVIPQPAPDPWAPAVLPNRLLALWPYARWDDPRLQVGERAVFVVARVGLGRLKIGARNTHGWMAYLRDGLVFVKRIPAEAGGTFPDLGCNSEIYCDERCIELEALGPLIRLKPGEETILEEVWEIYPADETPAELGKVIGLES
jgi:hypothetical protein